MRLSSRQFNDYSLTQDLGLTILLSSVLCFPQGERGDFGGKQTEAGLPGGCEDSGLERKRRQECNPEADLFAHNPTGTTR